MAGQAGVRRSRDRQSPAPEVGPSRLDPARGKTAGGCSSRPRSPVAGPATAPPCARSRTPRPETGDCPGPGDRSCRLPPASGAASAPKADPKGHDDDAMRSSSDTTNCSLIATTYHQLPSLTPLPTVPGLVFVADCAQYQWSQVSILHWPPTMSLHGSGGQWRLLPAEYGN